MSTARRATVGAGAVPVALAVVVAGALTGCGSSGSYANNPRPPAPIVVTVAIGPHKISASPASFGAGPIELVITNLNPHAQQLSLDSTDSSSTATATQQTPSIDPQNTASLKATMTTGTYTLKASTGSVTPATLHVGPNRPSAQNQLLQP